MQIEQNIFFDEFNNKLNILDNAISDVQNENYTKENIDEIFRSFHTIKSTADLLGLFTIVTLAHKAEDILHVIREEKIKIDSQTSQLLLDLKNFIAVLVENVAEGIFDDSDSEKLFNEFENALNQELHRIQDLEYSESDIKTILIVDDAAIIRYMIKKVASDAGYNVLTTDNTNDGWKKIQENAVDLLFCDFDEPNDEYKEFIELIRTDVSKKSLPLVMLLSNNNLAKTGQNIKELAKQTSAKAWIAKPLDEKKLQLFLTKVLSKK